MLCPHPLPNVTAPPQEKGRLQMAVKAEQQRRVKAEGELRRVQVRAAGRRTTHVRMANQAFRD